MENKAAIGLLINCLTNNEDHRQDLWVHYLSGNPVESLPDHLQKLAHSHSEDMRVKYAIWTLWKDPDSDKVVDFVTNNFSELERTIICMLMLGMSSEQISDYKNISICRIKQAISCIKYNPSWHNYGITLD